MVNSKKKGNRGERGVVNFFKDWTRWDFHRTPSSGGLQWKDDNRIKGDIVPPEKKIKKFPYVVEVKVRKKNKIEILDFLTGNVKNLIVDFWDQVTSDAKEVNKVPLLFFRYNGMERGLWLVGMERLLFNWIYDEDGVRTTDHIHINIVHQADMVLIRSDELRRLEAKTHFKDVKAYYKYYNK